MYDSYQWAERRKERGELRIVDYRNGKYQGATAGAGMVRTGVGMALDHNYLLALALWKAGRVEGEALIVYPDNSLFAGRVQNALPAGLCTYQVSKKCKIYGCLGSNPEDLFVFEDSKSQSLIFLTIAREVMQKMSEDPTANEYILLQESKRNSQAVRMRQENHLRSEDEKWDAVEKFLKTIVKTQHKDYKEFVKYYFSKRRGESDNVVEIGQAKEEFQFNFKNSSIICRLMESKSNQAEFRVKLMGYFDHVEQKMEISKKSVSGTSSIEESVKGDGIVYSENPIQRPMECVKKLHRYYRESLNFHNDYMEMDYLYRIKFIFHSIEEYIVHTSTNKYAQQLLENITPSTSPQNKRTYQNDKEIRHIPVSHEEHMNKDHLSKVKDDIYKAVQKKSLSKSHNTVQHQVNSYSHHDDSKYGQIFTKSPPRYEESLYEKTHSPPKRKEKKYLQEDHSLSRMSANQGQGRKSYVYLEDSMPEREKSKNKERVTPGKYEYSKSIAEKKEEPVSQLSKFAYLDKTQAKRTNKKLENLKTLTEYYEQIENELRKETPKKSNKTSKNFELSSNRLSPKPDASRRLPDKPPPHTASYSPLAPRRSYKYV